MTTDRLLGCSFQAFF